MHVNPAWVAAIAAASTGAGAFLLWLLRLLWRTVRRTIQFLDDFFGEPPRDGLPPRRGVMATLAEHEKLLSRLVAETEPNGGTSLRDVVARTAQDVADVLDEQTAVRARLEAFDAKHAGPDKGETK